MPLIGFTIRLDRLDEGLLYQAKDGSYWLSGVCVFETDNKGRTVVVQSIPPERYAAGEKGPQVGFWREIGRPKPTQSGEPGKHKFDLNKYKNQPAQTETAFKNGPGAYPQGEESLFPSPQAATPGRPSAADLLFPDEENDT